MKKKVILAIAVLASVVGLTASSSYRLSCGKYATTVDADYFISNEEWKTAMMELNEIYCGTYEMPTRVDPKAVAPQPVQ